MLTKNLVGLTLASVVSFGALAQEPYLTPDVRPRLLPENRFRLGVVGFVDRFGFVVEDVQPHSPADHNGIEPGDIITAINGRRIISYPQFRRFVATAPGFLRLSIVDVRTGRRCVRTIRMVESQTFDDPLYEDGAYDSQRRDRYDSHF